MYMKQVHWPCIWRASYQPQFCYIHGSKI